ncbi:hypothetical protein SAMN05443245_6995 [Paraburkholderia fungorum]|uniref:Chorismate mutase n=1 Tax=Paraburkholderia fungorum TaxID=134537 RepID=A0A1H1JQE2_9BURK|nr:hypothetical protein [Paraburkholderia fungorum]SDR51687.1 hypothetical protein SAMN05443245_6995 [Paraburkholderia fungorum]
MPSPNEIHDNLDDRDRKLLADALGALLRERSCALQIASDVAAVKGERGPTVTDFGLPDILRLSRMLSQSEERVLDQSSSNFRADVPI